MRSGVVSAPHYPLPLDGDAQDNCLSIRLLPRPLGPGPARPVLAAALHTACGSCTGSGSTTSSCWFSRDACRRLSCCSCRASWPPLAPPPLSAGRRACQPRQQLCSASGAVHIPAVAPSTPASCRHTHRHCLSCAPGALLAARPSRAPAQRTLASHPAPCQPFQCRPCTGSICRQQLYPASLWRQLLVPLFPGRAAEQPRVLCLEPDGGRAAAAQLEVAGFGATQLVLSARPLRQGAAAAPGAAEPGGTPQCCLQLSGSGPAAPPAGYDAVVFADLLHLADHRRALQASCCCPAWPTHERTPCCVLSAERACLCSLAAVAGRIPPPATPGPAGGRVDGPSEWVGARALALVWQAGGGVGKWDPAGTAVSCKERSAERNTADACLPCRTWPPSLCSSWKSCWRAQCQVGWQGGSSWASGTARQKGWTVLSPPPHPQVTCVTTARGTPQTGCRACTQARAGLLPVPNECPRLVGPPSLRRLSLPPPCPLPQAGSSA